MKIIKQSVREYWFHVLILADILIGLWLSSVYVYIFLALTDGGMVGEPDMTVARWELYLSIVVTCWFLWQVPFFVVRAVKKDVGNIKGIENNQG